MVQCSFLALGTKWWIEIFDKTNEETLARAFSACEQTARTFEKNYSRFLPDSLVSTLNREGKITQPAKEFQSLLTYGKLLYETTNGVFNLLNGEQITNSGYDSEYSFIPKDSTKRVSRNPLTELLISSEEIILRSGMVDIGGYGKGYLIDVLKEELHSQGIHYFLINGGGDMYVSSNHGEPIEIYLEHPTEPSQYVIKTTLLNEGFAASSSYKRKWEHEGISYAHIMNAKNEIPGFSTYVKASSAAKADAFATTTLLVSEAECLHFSQQEALEIARFNPETNQFWSTVGFQ